MGDIKFVVNKYKIRLFFYKIRDQKSYNLFLLIFHYSAYYDYDYRNDDTIILYFDSISMSLHTISKRKEGIARYGT